MTLLLVALVVAGIVVLTPVADRTGVPQPILLLIYGLVLALVPALPELTLDADLVLPVVLPPLLFAATQRTTAGQFRDQARPVLLLAVGLTLASAAVVTLVAHLAGLPWAAAAVLGAIVSPPDPVAATAVARRLRLPEGMVTVLEGEGMFNDATALVLYKVTVAVVVTGEFSTADAATELVLALAVGGVGGLVVGRLTKVALAALHDAAAETTVTIAAPFVAYLGVEHLGGSGVLAVLGLGLYLRSAGHSSLTAQGWLLGRSVWEYADFVVTGLVFVLVGVELTTVLEHSSTDASTMVIGVLVIGTLVLLRPLWIFPAVAVARASARRRETGLPYGWRETAVVSWAGMRGVVTVATALALPATAEDGGALSWRESVVLIGLGSVLVTLLLQGLTLSPMVRRLGVGAGGDERAEVAGLRRRALEAALGAVRREAESGDEAYQVVVRQYEGRLEAHDALQDGRRGAGPDGAGDEALDERLLRAILLGADTEREVVLSARSSGDVTPAAADEVLHEVEARAARLW